MARGETPGVLITFEGGEGSGKTTQVKALANALRAQGLQVVDTRDPGGTPVGKEIRGLLLGREYGPMAAACELFLYEASRAQLVQEVVGPALREGRIVLSDRFTDSTTAYQGYGRGLDLGMIRHLNALASDGLAPDLTLLLDLDPRAGLERAGRSASTGRGRRDRIEAEELAFHRRVREGYLALARAEPGRIRVIDALGGMAEIERTVRAEVAGLLRARGLLGGS